MNEMSIRISGLLTLLLGTSYAANDRYMQCGEKLHGYHGQFHSPNYPSPYPNNLKCTWQLSVPNGYGVQLNFTQFDLEYSDQCQYDYVKLQSRNGTLGKYCGQRSLGGVGSIHSPPLRPIVVTDSALDVLLYTDYSNEVEFFGFQAHFVGVDINECAENNGGCAQICHNYVGGFYCSCRFGYRLALDGRQCIVQCRGIHLSKLSGVITTPEYPNAYPPFAQCDWHVTADKGYVVVIEFDEFRVEEHYQAQCPYDYVLIEDERAKHGPFCGNKMPDPFRSASNWLIIEFVSDKSREQKGFKAKYRIQGRSCPPLMAPENGEIIGPTNVTFKDTLTFTCHWGYELEGSASRECLSDGTWSGTLTICSRIRCDHPRMSNPGLQGVFFDAREEGNFAGERVIKMCAQHYELEGPSEMTCLTNRTWTNASGVCRQTCGTGDGLFQRMSQCDKVSHQLRANAEEEVFLWTVAIRMDGEVICSGVLINEEFVLTAAFCTKTRLMTSLDVVLGTHNTKWMHSGVQVRKVVDVKTHNNFQGSSFTDDVALLKLDKKVKFGYYIQPICLPYLKSHKTLFRHDSSVGAVGFRAAKGNEHMLSERCALIMPRSKCNPYANNISATIFESSDRGIKFIRRNGVLCTKEKWGSSDTCMMLPGGGLYARDEQTKKWYLGGLHVWGKDNECFYKEGMFNVFLRLNRYIKWILQETHSKIDKFGLYDMHRGRS